MNNAQCSAPAAQIVWADQSAFPLDWNGPVGRPFEAFPDAFKWRPIIELLEAVVLRRPQRIALADAAVSITYAEAWHAAAAWAECIAAATEPGDLVAILAPASTSFPIAMLACLAAGRVFVALDPGYPPEWINLALEDCRPALLLVSNASQGAARSLLNAPRTLNLDDAQPPASNFRPAPLPPDEPAWVLFTSGSTGQPKGVVNSQRNLLQRVGQSINAAHIDYDDRLLSLTSPCTIVGVRDMITALLAGASVYLLDPQAVGTREILRVIRDRRISILFAFPALLRSVVEGDPAAAGGHLRLVRVGGDTTLWSDIALLRNWLRSGGLIQLIYAATEAPMMQWFVNEAVRGDDDRIPIGYPLPGNALAVVDEDGEPVADGEVGELLVRSPYVALGCWTAGRCDSRDFPSDGDGRLRTLRTGDLVRRRPDGLYDRIGRRDRQVKIRGVRVELDGVEAAIRRHASVRDVAVVMRTCDGAGRLVAFVQPNDSAPGDFLDELAAMMRRAVPPHMRPWRFYAAPLIPRLPTSKLDARALRAMDREKIAEEAARLGAPAGTGLETDPIGTLVAHIWRDQLGLALTAADDDFFDLGGDSLRAITMTAELEKTLGRELPMTLINQAPTFAAFCARLREKGPVPYDPLVLLKPGHGSPPVFLIHGVGGSVMELYPLGRKMRWQGPVIGIQARGLDGQGPPHGTIETMAEEYLAAVKARQPNGPYFLCGYSFGGLVAFEMACRLEARGEAAAFVGVFATLPSGHRLLRVRAWMAYFLRRVAKGVFTKNNRPFRAWAEQARARAEKLRAHQGAPPALRAVAERAMSASAAYRPGTYAGELWIFEPSSRDLRLPPPSMLWSRHARVLRQHSLPGRHGDMLFGAHTEAAAERLTQCLEAAALARQSAIIADIDAATVAE